MAWTISGPAEAWHFRRLVAQFAHAVPHVFSEQRRDVRQEASGDMPWSRGLQLPELLCLRRLSSPVSCRADNDLQRLHVAGSLFAFLFADSQAAQTKKPMQITTQAVLGYFVRFLACFCTMELILHFMYVVAIKDARAWTGATPAELCMIGFWNLIVVWLKVRLFSGRRVPAPTHAAAHPMALLPPVGTRRRAVPAGEHGALHGEQLLRARLLARMAPQLQPVDRALRVCPRGRRAPRRARDAARVHVRRAVARPLVAPARVGVAHLAVHPPRAWAALRVHGDTGASASVTIARGVLIGAVWEAVVVPPCLRAWGRRECVHDDGREPCRVRYWA